MGCSRPVAENNKWLPKSSYMGITGVQVKPELILLLGVSGQIQHVGGISKSRVRKKLAARFTWRSISP